MKIIKLSDISHSDLGGFTKVFDGIYTDTDNITDDEFDEMINYCIENNFNRWKGYLEKCKAEGHLILEEVEQ